MAGEIFKLNFITGGEGIKSISEPVGFDSADFVTKQKEKGLGRDVSFSGGEVQFEFYRMLKHEFELLTHYHEVYGWESEVELIIEIDGYDNIIGYIDFFYAETDQLEYFKCKIIQNNNQSILKKRREINVDLFSDEDLDGNSIEPIVPENVLILAKPSFKLSKWSVDSSGGGNTGFSNGFHTDFRNYFKQIESSDIDDTLTVFKDFVTLGGSKLNLTDEDVSNFNYLEAQNNLRNVKISVEGFKLFNLIPTGEDYNDNNTPYSFSIHYSVGVDTDTKSISNGSAVFNYTPVFDANVNIQDYFPESSIVGNADKYDLEPDDLTLNIGNIPRGNKLYVYINVGRYNTFTKWTEGEIKVTASSLAYNTISPSLRLHDVVSKNVESISELDINFPIADVSGELYNHRILNGNLLRGITDRPFNISLKDIESWLPEIYGDYEIQEDGNVFFGIYEDYYTNEEIGFFDTVRYDDYKKYFNEKLGVNEFNYKYKKYQSQKENEEDNTFDIVHGSSQWSIQNRGVENSKTVEVSFVRDSFLLDSQRKKAFNISENTSTQDDETKFIVDTKEVEEDLVFTEVDELLHTFEDNNLKLTNNGDFSFELLGIREGETFVILGSDLNAGNYEVLTVSGRYLTLNRLDGIVSPNNDGERLTEFRYIISKDTVKYITWSTEDFEYINGTTDSDGFANLKYTIKRNILKYYNSYLASCNFFNKDTEVKNTLYVNNKELDSSYQGSQVIEGDNFIPTNPILSPYMHDITITCDFTTFKTLENNLKTKRGYVRVLDNKGHVIKVYPQELKYVNDAEVGELFIKGEGKFIDNSITIDNSLGYILINNEYRTNTLTYELKSEKISIFDEENKLLYNPIYWKEVNVNGANASTQQELTEWLDLLS